MITPVPL